MGSLGRCDAVLGRGVIHLPGSVGLRVLPLVFFVEVVFGYLKYEELLS